MGSWDSLGFEQQEAQQMARLRRFLREQILPFHPHYGELFAEHGIEVDSLRSYADLAQIPLSSKADVAPDHDDPQRPKKFVLQPTPETLRASLPLGRKLSLLWTKTRHGV